MGFDLVFLLLPTSRLVEGLGRVEAWRPDSGGGLSHRYRAAPAGWRRVSQQRAVPGVARLPNADLRGCPGSSGLGSAVWCYQSPGARPCPKECTFARRLLMGRKEI